MVAVLRPGYGGGVATAAGTATAERCLRCSAGMEWRHGTWQCPRCRFKLGCCEGETGECDGRAAARQLTSILET